MADRRRCVEEDRQEYEGNRTVPKRIEARVSLTSRLISVRSELWRHVTSDNHVIVRSNLCHLSRSDKVSGSSTG
ncbi:hypothetical protein J6590_045082 [Homalodisca vitripennis]|nr:hypothetical protein J6590_045082 [Homalodisca vitripennis]